MIEPLPSDMFRAGDVLNNTYEVEGVLGRGGTGEVYRVVNKLTGRVFAVKVLNARFAGNEDFVELMKREEEMRSILHECVVRYNECWQIDSGAVILVMDYIPGPSLSDEMAARQLSEKELLIVAHRIARGLVAAHGHGIVHRDLSPDNIILKDGAADQATIIDFGIAKDTAEGARTIVGNDFAGKYEYAAPEQLDGKAEAKSDLYALGATLLAAYRGETPYLGTTPGEIVRRKAAPLDTDAVPERLKELIEALTDPDPDKRPRDAAATVALIDGLLEDGKLARGGRGQTVRAKRPAKAGAKRRMLPLLLGGAGLAALLGIAVLIMGLIAPGLPEVAPYTLSAQKAVDGRTLMTGHAPDQAASDALVAAFVAGAGAPEAAAEITLANTVPVPDWAGEITRLIAVLEGMPRWRFDVVGETVMLSALAPDVAGANALRAALETWEANSDLALDREIRAGPEMLSQAALNAALATVQSCGPLLVEGAQFALGEVVPVRGLVAEPGDEVAVADLLRRTIGSRSVDLDLTVLNPDVCAIRDVLPPVGPGPVSIWLGNGRDGSANLTGVYRTGENPVVDILVPPDVTDAFLWVMVIDTTGKVFHVLPNINATEQRIEALGTIEGGVRRIRVLHSEAALAADPKKLVVRVLEESYGKSEVVAFLSKVPLFDVRRPRDESTSSVKEALTEALQGRETEIISVATRFIDARP